MKKRLLFVVNDIAFFRTHRLPIAVAALAAGYDVHLAAAGGIDAKVEAAGVIVHDLVLSRSGLGPVAEFRTIAELVRLMRRLRPEIVHLVTPKPVLYGGIAARLAGVPSVVSAVSGMGYIFSSRDIKALMLRPAVKILYRLAFGHPNMRVIFQNAFDRDFLVGNRTLHRSRTVIIPGSGVDLTDYGFEPEPSSPAHVVFAARLLKDKGIVEFVEAARRLRLRGAEARFSALGDLDPGNPASVTPATLAEWRNEGIVAFPGYQPDMAAQFQAANIVVLPSYREGLPKTLIEAASCGRAVVTTDVPGCRDAIEPDRTGLLVPVRDSEALASAVERLVRDPDLRGRMGAAGRALAARKFAIGKIVEAHLDLYELLISTALSARASEAPVL